MKSRHEIKNKKNRRKITQSIQLVMLTIIMLVIAALLLKFMLKKENTPPKNNINQEEEISPSENTPNDSQTNQDNLDEDKTVYNPDEDEALEHLAEQEAKEQLTQLMEKADRTAKGYDYDAAIDLLKELDDYESNTEIMARIQAYEGQKEGLVEWEDVTKISHVFFHSLVVDNSKAFDGDIRTDGYNTNMTTVDEFNKIMEQMYERGYVLVSLHDMADFVTTEDGSVKFTKGKIMLPEGKIPFVLSQDDVNYYDYMKEDGFAHRLVIGEDGMVTTEMDLEDGTSVQGSYDMVPLLEDFIKEHPDFSYRGARGILAITGYEGVFGYRTSRRSYPDSLTIEEDTKKAIEVANRLKEMGWEFASHGWGHKNMGQISYERFVWDVDKWEEEVEPILGETDIYIYPYGNDIEDWREYKGDRYEYFKSKGFVYFCNVDAAGPYWGQITDKYLRQGRINLDGMRMYEAISGGRNRVEPFFDVDYVFDKTRPLPVR